MPVRSTGKIVSQAELAEIFGVQPATIRSWQKAGAPVERKGGAGRTSLYNTALVIRWRTAMAQAETADVTLDEGRRRKVAAEAQLAEIALELKRREVVPLAPVLRHAQEAFSNYRRELQTLPARCGAQMAAEVGCEVAVLDAALSKVIREHLEGLSAPVVKGA